MSSGVVVACTWSGCHDQAGRLLALARKAAAGLAADVRWLLLGCSAAGVEEIGTPDGATGVDCVSDPQLDVFQPDTYVEALARYAARARPSLLLFSQTFDVRVAAPRLAGRLDCSIVMNGLDVEFAGGRLQVTASAYGGDMRAVYALGGQGPHIVCMMPDAVAPAAAEGSEPPQLREVEVDLAGVSERLRVVQAARRQGPRLEEAQVVVAGGRGLGSAANFALVEELAEAFGGLPAASRPIVDDGWTDSARQVGLTGKIIRPAVYIALGISGASQHMAGCAAAKAIVAVNRDPEAAIFRYARYGVVGDCLEVARELIRTARKR